MQFYWDFYSYFTNLSNYLCIAVMAAELVQTARRSGDGSVTALPRLKFVCLTGITLTFLVFNVLLAGQPGRDPALNYKVSSVLLHIVLPLLYIGDWLLFYPHRRLRPADLVRSTLLPLAYLAFVAAQAIALDFNASILNSTAGRPLIYPYFFLDLSVLGPLGVARWCLIMVAAFFAIAAFYYALDRLLPGER
ncbi:MAG: Pr6Pr family membrane protein [Clostridia bacterium]|nr:Pr6Pr family membrane protein [Clostridia bacterium]